MELGVCLPALGVYASKTWVHASLDTRCRCRLQAEAAAAAAAAAALLGVPAPDLIAALTVKTQAPVGRRSSTYRILLTPSQVRL